MTDLLTRARTLLTALPTWLTVLAVVLTIIVQQLAGYVDNPTVAGIVNVLAAALTVIGVAISIVRRVTPVIAGDRGLLPIANPIPANSVPDRGASTIELVVLIVVVILAFIGLAHLLGWSLS